MTVRVPSTQGFYFTHINVWPELMVCQVWQLCIYICHASAWTFPAWGVGQAGGMHTLWHGDPHEGYTTLSPSTTSPSVPAKVTSASHTHLSRATHAHLAPYTLNYSLACLALENLAF